MAIPPVLLGGALRGAPLACGALTDLWTTLHGVAILFGQMHVRWAVPVLPCPRQQPGYHMAPLTPLATGLQVLLAESKRGSHAGVHIAHHDPAWQGYCSACLVAQCFGCGLCEALAGLLRSSDALQLGALATTSKTFLG